MVLILPAATLVATGQESPIRAADPTDIDLPGVQDVVAMNAVAAVQDLYTNWYQHFKRVKVSTGGVGTVPAPATRGVGCFFSGGVDSFYSVIEARQEITHLIFVIGFDIDPANTGLAARALGEVRAAAAELNKSLIEVRTNIRAVTDPLADWGKEYHGAALASVGLMLRQHLARIYIPASYHHSELFAWGSHPELDPLWNTSDLEFVHHGVGADRPEKVARISTEPPAMNHLRVCWENRDNAYNCGRCEKWVRTVINLRAAGAEGKCKTLPREAALTAMRRFRASHGSAAFARQNLDALERAGVSDPELTKALKRLIRSAPMWELARKLKRSIS